MPVPSRHTHLEKTFRMILQVDKQVTNSSLEDSHWIFHGAHTSFLVLITRDFQSQQFGVKLQNRFMFMSARFSVPTYSLQAGKVSSEKLCA